MTRRMLKAIIDPKVWAPTDVKATLFRVWICIGSGSWQPVGCNMDEHVATVLTNGIWSGIGR
jgi:hypothetical protein